MHKVLKQNCAFPGLLFLVSLAAEQGELYPKSKDLASAPSRHGVPGQQQQNSELKQEDQSSSSI